jgi:hypothetical protein
MWSSLNQTNWLDVTPVIWQNWDAEPVPPSGLSTVSITPYNESSNLTYTLQEIRMVRNTDPNEALLYSGANGVVFVNATSDGNWQKIYTKESGDFILQQIDP